MRPILILSFACLASLAQAGDVTYPSDLSQAAFAARHIREALQKNALSALSVKLIFEALLKEREPVSNASILYDTLQAASKIVPLVSRSMAMLGQFYADKIRATVSYGFFLQSENETYRTELNAHLEAGFKHWTGYTMLCESRYHPPGPRPHRYPGLGAASTGR